MGEGEGEGRARLEDVDEEGECRDCGSEEALEPGTVRFDMSGMYSVVFKCCFWFEVERERSC